MAGVQLPQIRVACGKVEVMKRVDVAIPKGAPADLVALSGRGTSTSPRTISCPKTPTGGRIVAGGST